MRSTRQILGDSAEDAAEAYFRSQNLPVVGRNVRFGHLELDLLVRDGPVLAVVEVRTRGRGALTRGLDSIDWRKQRKLRWAADRLWLHRERFGRGIERIRFDALSVSFHGVEPRIEHVKAAF